ncbi:MAG: iron chelate uptake ABC transporter family permease subunit [Actinomycetota bacterium]|nr:iron chelate uptake ABC transporter family permease subunit [Actinomycetota bacterium]
MVRLVRPPVSMRVDRRAGLVAAGLLVVIAGAVVASVRVGDFALPLSDVVAAIVGLGSPDATFIVQGLRLPRAVTGLMVGAAFGLAGAIFQTLARNPLASPDIIGVTAGAGLAAVAAIVLAGAGTAAIAGAAFAGGLGTMLAVYLLAYCRGVTGYRLVLVGIGLTAVGSSLTSWLLTKANLYDAQEAAIWLTGSLNNRGWEHVVPVGLALAVLLPVTALLAPQLRCLQLGDELARGLGIRVETCRLALLAVGVALASLATASAGPVAFVALIGPQIAKRLCRASGIALVPAALTGAALVLVADLLGRQLFSPVSLPVGVVTAVVGAPFLLWLLAQTSRTGRGG